MARHQLAAEPHFDIGAGAGAAAIFDGDVVQLRDRLIHHGAMHDQALPGPRRFDLSGQRDGGIRQADRFEFPEDVEPAIGGELQFAARLDRLTHRRRP